MPCRGAPSHQLGGSGPVSHSGAFVCVPNEKYQPRHVLRAVGCMRLSAKQPIVVSMAANPEPDEPVCRFGRESAVVSSNPSRPEPADFLEVKGGMPRILLQARVRLIGEIPNLGRQRSVQRPEVGRRVMSQRGVVLPAA
jgi:hypothetical protein